MGGRPASSSHCGVIFYLTSVSINVQESSHFPLRVSGDHPPPPTVVFCSSTIDSLSYAGISQMHSIYSGWVSARPAGMVLWVDKAEQILGTDPGRVGEWLSIVLA